MLFRMGHLPKDGAETEDGPHPLGKRENESVGGGAGDGEAAGC